MTRTRQLAAIMFTDIQGYTRLMQQNEQKAVQFREKHRKIFNSFTEKYNGKILQYYGDGTLSIFDSAIDAVNCAIEMQRGFMQEPAIPVRIGIHTGDIIYSKEEVIGDGVNIAARIEALAKAGSILISERVYDDIKNQDTISATRLKQVNLKNVERPVEIYAITNEGVLVPKASEIDTSAQNSQPVRVVEKNIWKKAVSIFFILLAVIAVSIFVYPYFADDSDSPVQTIEKSIAVLPFINMSNDPEQEYFSDGITEEILNSLVKVDGLKVAGRTSSFSFKGKNEDIRTIGDKLDVKMVLEGSVRKSANQVRITAQLISVEDGFHLWSETYNREIEDIFSVQEDIARQIVEKLKLQINPINTSQSQTENTEAYEMYLKGTYFFKRGSEDTEKALHYFQKAVELDPGYAEAHAFIAETYLHLAGYNLMSAAEGYSLARSAARKAIDINEFEPRAHKILAYIALFYDWNWETARSEYEKAVQYGLPQQNEFITYLYIFLDTDYNQAIRISKEILETDPLYVVNHWQLGICYYFAGRFEEALVSFNNALELDPNYSDALHQKGLALAYLGRYDEAVSAMQRTIEITQGKGLAELDFLAVKILMGKKDEVLMEIRSMEFIDAMDAARLYTMLDMPDEAFEWMEKGYRERSSMMATLKSWFWDPLRDDPRFINIYQRMNFPE